MKFSLNLLKQFVKIDISPEKLAQILTEHAFEVEEVTSTSGGFNLIVAAKVLSAEKHPNADRLRVIKLDIGGRIVEPVVCGAFNFGAGDMVALALPGATIAQNIHSETHESFILEKAKIRGVESQGMICAEFELGLAKVPGDKPEIMLLNKSVAAGTPLHVALDLKAGNYVLNVSLPANRPDLHSHLGLSREIAAVLNKRLPATSYRLPAKLKPSKKWKVIVKDKVHCLRYYGIRMKVKVGPSPKFMADLLAAVGMRPINNVVDITNYVMMELGNPTHAFDAKFVEGNIVVQNAKKGQKFVALNHKEYALDDDILMIADQKKNLAIGAIIGGKQSEVSEATSEIILEVANFEPTGIRKTGKKLGVATEGSRMWEKGVHPKLAEIALTRSLELLQKYADGKIIEFAQFETPVKNPASIKFSADGINKLLGTDVKSSDISKYLSRYGITAKDKGLRIKVMTAAPPWWRADVTTVPDLAEEVLKLFGYNKVTPKALGIIPSGSEGSLQNITDDIYKAKSLFARLGYSEVQNYNFVSEKDILNFGARPQDHIEISNPLSEDQRYMQKYPLIPLLKNIALNQKHFSKFKIFEIGKQYFGFENEPLVLLSAIFNKRQPLGKLIMAVKADVLELLKSFGIKDAKFVSDSNINWLHLKIRETDIGGIGYLQPDLAKKFDVDGNTAFAKLELEKILAQKQGVLYEPIGKFPRVERDISIIVDQKVSWGIMEAVVAPFMGLQGPDKIVSDSDPGSGNYTVSISLFEAPFLTYDKDSVKFHQELAKQGKKNLGIRLLFKPKNHTLTDAEITGILDKIVVRLKQELNAEIR